MLQEDIASRLLWVDTDTIVRDDGAEDMLDYIEENIKQFGHLVAGGTLNSSAANLRTAVNGVPSGTERTLNGSFGSEVRVILNVTLDPPAAGADMALQIEKFWVRFSSQMAKYLYETKLQNKLVVF